MSGKTLKRDKWVRIMCDYSADGVWDSRGAACDAADLPVSSGTLAMIRGWQAWYEHAASSDMSHLFDDAGHAAFGLFVARCVKRELPDWTVIYLDDSKPRNGWQPGEPRDHFEYEIILTPDGSFLP